MNILIVDDEKLIVDDLIEEVREIYPEALIDGVTDSLSAEEISRDKGYDIALLDIDMPEMDGLILARKLIASSPAINIIFVTGYPEYALKAHDLYCSAFLLKPVGLRKLKSAFANLRKPLLTLPKNFLEENYSGSSAIGKRLETVRKQRGISRQDLAELMKVKRQTIYRWEQGDRLPDIITFLKLTRILGVNLEQLIGMPDDSQHNDGI